MNKHMEKRHSSWGDARYPAGLAQGLGAMERQFLQRLPRDAVQVLYTEVRGNPHVIPGALSLQQARLPLPVGRIAEIEQQQVSFGGPVPAWLILVPTRQQGQT